MSLAEFVYKKSRYKVPARFFGKIARTISRYEFSMRWEKGLRGSLHLFFRDTVERFHYILQSDNP